MRESQRYDRNGQPNLAPQIPTVSGVRTLAQMIVVGTVFLFASEPSRSQESIGPQSAPPAVSQSFSGDGIGSYVPGAWGSVGVRVENTTDEPIEVLSVMYFDTDSQRQYSRQVWVPPRSRRSTWIGALTPQDLSPATRSLGIKTILYNAGDSGDQGKVIRTASGQVLGDALLSVANLRPTIGVISDVDDQKSLDAVVATRLVRGLTRRFAMLDGDALPVTCESLEGLDQLVLMSDRPAADAAGISAIRQWLEAGGRLWVMLDQVRSATVARLLGDALQVYEVDRVELMDCTVRREYVGGFAPQELSLEFENPVEFVRVVATDARILQTISGWPASFELRLGKGLVLCTTLAGHGWVRPPRAQDPTSPDPEKQASLVATGALGDIAFRFSGQRALPALEPNDFRDFLFEQVGSRIVSRELVVLVLGAFWICLVGLGFWLVYLNRLVYLGWIGPVMAAVATIALVWLGDSSRRDAPDTVAQGQFVEVGEGGSQIAISGLMSLYHQEATSAPLGAVRGGVFVPELAEQSGSVRRMVRTDIDQWHFEEFSQPPGMLFAPFSQVSRIDKPISAKAMFGPEGIVGTLSLGPFRDASDLVIATPGYGGLSVHLPSPGKFAAEAADVLRAEEFIGGTILTDEQRRRQAVYRKLLPEHGEFPLRPTLLAWAEPFDLKFTLPPDAEYKGTALLAIPLEFARTPPGTQLTIAAPFLPFQPVGAAGVYDVSTHQWIVTNLARRTLLRFQIPRGVLPIRLHRATLTISIKAPSRTVDIFAGRGEDTVTLETVSSPIGTLHVETDQAQALSVDATGGLYFGIDVSDPNRADEEPVEVTPGAFDWSIQSLQLQLRAESLPR